MVVVFDLDGTLTRTVEADAECFAAAFRDTFGRALPTADWSRYRHATDRGIVEEALGMVGLTPAADGVATMQARFAAALAACLPAGLALQVPGCGRLLRHLRTAGVAVAIATGAWRCSAALKLERAGLAGLALPLATSDEDADRLAIVRRAVTLAGGGREGARVVYVGDGVWDLATARRGGFGFVGVDCAGSGALRAAGAPAVLRDFDDLEATVRALASA